MLPDDVVQRAGRPMLVGAARDAPRANLSHASARLGDGSLAVTRRPAGVRGASHLRAAVVDRGRVFAVGWTDGAAITIRHCGPAAAAALFRSRASSRQTGLRSLTRSQRIRLSGEVPRRTRLEDAHRAAGLLPRPAASSSAMSRDASASGWSRRRTAPWRPTSTGMAGTTSSISRHQQKGRVLLNRRGHFRPAPSDPLRVIDRHGCDGADLDGDGDEEIHCAIGASGGVKFKANELLLEPQRARQGNAAWTHGVADPIGRGRLASFVQIDGDRAPELLVTNDPLRVDGLPAVNRLYQNDGDGSGMRPATGLGLDLPIGGECALSAAARQGRGRRSHRVHGRAMARAARPARLPAA